MIDFYSFYVKVTFKAWALRTSEDYLDEVNESLFVVSLLLIGERVKICIFLHFSTLEQYLVTAYWTYLMSRNNLKTSLLAKKCPLNPHKGSVWSNKLETFSL